jgi:phenylalanyl-tRNA synthetase beta subunit
VAAGRIAQLLAEAGIAETTGPLGLVGAWQDPARVVELRADEASRFLGRDFAEAEIVERLSAYGFAHQGKLAFRVPPHRIWDVESEEDLFEELARSVGFNDLPEGLPPVGLGARPSRAEVLTSVAEDVLVGAGFYEVYTDGFYSRQVPERLGQSEGSPLFSHVETINSLDNSFSLLKNNCLAQAVQAVADNVNVKAQDVRLYEWTRTFHPDPKAANKVCRERDVLYGICSGRERPDAWETGRNADVFFLKGLFEQLIATLDLPLTLGDPDPSYRACCKPSASSSPRPATSSSRVTCCWRSLAVAPPTRCRRPCRTSTACSASPYRWASPYETSRRCCSRPRPPGSSASASPTSSPAPARTRPAPSPSSCSSTPTSRAPPTNSTKPAPRW